MDEDPSLPHHVPADLLELYEILEWVVLTPELDGER